MRYAAILLILAGCQLPLDEEVYWQGRGRAPVVYATKRAMSPPTPTPPLPDDVCPDCRGTGKVGDGTIERPCGNCDGTGRITESPAERGHPSASPEPDKADREPVESGQGIIWTEDYKAALASGRPVLVLLGGDWCEPCQRLKRRLQAFQELQEWVLVDLDAQEPFGPQGTNMEALAAAGQRDRVPYLVLIAPNRDILWRGTPPDDLEELIRRYNGQRKN